MGGSPVAAVPPPEGMSSLIFRLARRALLVGLVLSILFHLVGLAVSSRIMYGLGGKPGPVGEQPVGLALTRGPELGELMASSIEVGLPSSGDLSSEQKRSTSDQPLDVPRDPTLSNAGGLEASGALSGAGNVSGGDSLGEGLGAGGGGGGGASFFGVEAQGSRFVFVVDISGSMSVGGKIEALRAQLSKSIQNLVETSYFAVFAFSDLSTPLGNARDWVQALEERKRWARKQITALTPQGGTQPLDAFRSALKLRPRPDAIYFMTDGEFDPLVADEVARMNTSRIPIHCIAFTTRDSEALLKKMANQSRGSYTYVPGVTP
ncbi:MAG: VWA domain-containing protein [Phycisphaerales bacterium]